MPESASTAERAPPPDQGRWRAARHLRYIDCTRGYAVLMVITSHLTYKFPQLPYPVSRITTMGWFGVQLFYLASCLTLMMSWHAEAARGGGNDVTGFFVRRYFRIAPAYYAAAVFYFVFAPPPGGFDPVQVLTSAAFVNAWYPDWMPVGAQQWRVVPGGWSIGVEFTFYALFPMYAAWTTSMRRALAGLAAAVGFGLVANLVAGRLFAGFYPPDDWSDFLFFWFPNQMSVFALGGVLYYLIGAVSRAAWRDRAARIAPVAVGLAFAAFCGLAYVPLGHFIGDRPSVPASLAVSVIFVGLIVALAAEPWLFSNRLIAAVGKVSFSAYLVHFAVLDVFDGFPGAFQVAATGYRAILAFCIGWVVAVAAVFVVSSITYRLIELPMMTVGSALNRRRRLSAAR
jgi:peptidoglycan/LPS O-acetylase OafA/YrhL